jgi:predicted ABC-type ATPase
MSDLIAVVGPNGSGKSSLVYGANIDRAFTFINPDDIARRDFVDVADAVERNKLAWNRCNELRAELVENGVSFGFETVGSHPSRVELLRKAKQLGYTVTLLFVATENPEVNIRRIADRVAKGGHAVPDDRVKERYVRTLRLLPEYFDVADLASIWDNTNDAERGAIRELMRKDSDGRVTVLPAAKDVAWIHTYLLDK